MCAEILRPLRSAILAASSLLAGTPSGFSHDRSEPSVLDPLTTKASPAVFGSRFCAACHGNPALRTDLCRMTESYYWENCDPHRLALDWGPGDDATKYGGFRSPAGQRANAIGRRLGIGDVTTSRQCTGCHSVSVPDDSPYQNFGGPWAEGVTCVACHGPYKGWVTEHQVANDPTWKHLTRLQKWVNYGMVDLWDPVVRAQSRMSCHIGDPRAGRMITHAMYAAGHPPLPSIEVAAFSEEQPRHWLELRCKNSTVQKSLEFNSERLEQTEQMLIGALVALSRTMELFEAEARNRTDQSAWPEFARFDCSACHHELEVAGERSGRPVRARTGLGRPLAPSWPMALVPLAIDAADPQRFESRAAELDARLTAFHAALMERPFGDSEKTATAARAIIDWANSPLVDLGRLTSVKRGEKRRVLDRVEALRLLRRLGQIAAAGRSDYESARQMGWAFRTIVHELRDVTTGRPSGNTAHNNLARNQPRIEAILKALDADLILSLRERGNEGSSACPPPDQVMAYPTVPDQKPIVGALLEVRLKRLADYDPEALHRRFAELERLVPAP
jgi:hypothetical protein